MYARITTAQIKPGAVDEALQIWDGQAMAQMTKQKGYKGVQLCTDRSGNKMVTTTYWETREDADKTMNSDYMRQVIGLFTNVFAGPPTQEHYEVERDERA